MAQRRLSLVLDLDTGRYSGRLTQAGSQMRQFGGTVDRTSQSVRRFSDGFDRMGSAMKSPRQALRDYVLILGDMRLALLNVRDLTIGWVGALIGQSAKVERLMVLMQGLSQATTAAGKSTEAKQNLSDLFSMARKTGFAVEDLTDSFVKFQSAKLNPRDGSLQALADAVAAFGGTSDVMKRASIAIQQMAGKGVISMEELRQQLGEAVPTAMADMARAMGKTVAELSKEVATGTVAAGPALALMFAEMQRTYAGAGRRLAETMTGQLAELHTNITALSTDFTQLGNKQGLFAGTTAAIKDLNTALKGQEGKEFMRSLGDAVAAVGGGLVSAAKVALEWRNELGAVFKTIAAGIAMVTAARLAAWMRATATATVASFTAIGGQYRTLAAEMTAYNQVLRGNVTSQNQWAIQNNAAAQQLQVLRHRIDQERTLIGVTRLAQAEGRQQIASMQQRAQAYRNVIPLMENQVRVSQRELNTARTLHQANIAVGRDSVASAQNVAAAQRQLTRDTTALGITRTRLRGVTREMVVAETQLAAAQTAETAATARLTAAEAMNTLGKRAMAAATTIAAGATRVLGAAMSVALGPIGMVTMGLYMVAQAAGVFETAADRASAAAARMADGFQKAGDAAVVAARKASVAADIASIEKGGMFSVEHGDNWWNTGVRFNTNQAETLKAKRAELKSLDDAEINGRRASYVNRTQAWQDYVVNGHQTYVDRLTESYNRELRNADKNIKDKNQLLAKQKQLRETYDAKVARDMTRREDDLQRRIDERTAKGLNAGPLRTALSRLRQQSMTTAAGVADLGAAAGGSGAKGLDKFARSAAMADAKVAGINAKLAGTGVKLAEFNSKLASGMFKGMTDDQIASLRRAATATDALAASKKAAAAEDNGFEGKLMSMAGRLAQLQERLVDSNGELAKFNAQLAASGDKMGLSPAQIQQLQDLAQAIDEADHTADVKARMDSLGEALAKATTEGDELWASFSRGTLEADNRLASIRARFADKLIGLSGAELENAKRKIDEIVAAIERADAVEVVDGWKRSAEEMQIALLDENEQREANFKRELERQQILLNAIRANAALSVADKQRAEQNFLNWKAAAEARDQRASEGRLAAQARQWASLGQNIQGVMTEALGSIVEGMMDADMNFGDLVSNIIKKILTVIMQAMIAYAILSAIGMANNSAGEHVSMGSFLKGQMAGGMTVGGKTDPKTSIGFGASGANLTGVQKGPSPTWGQVGHESQTAGSFTTIFDSVKKRHNGGWLGGRQLQSGEVPFIGLEDEVILNKSQQRAIGGMIGGSGGMPTVNVNVINNSGTELETEHGEPEFNGKDMVVNIVVEAAQKQGKLRDVFMQMQGGN